MEIISGPHYSTEYDAFYYRVRFSPKGIPKTILENELDWSAKMTFLRFKA